MAEKGVLVADVTGGESVACRDAIETDENSNARIIQRVDVCKGQLPTPFRAAANLLRSDIGADGTDAANWSSAGVFSTVLTVGDKSTLVVQIQTMATTTGTVDVIPVLLEADGTTIVGTLDKKTSDFLNGGDRVELDAGADVFYVCPMLTWDVTGARKIAMVFLKTDDSYLTVNIYGAVI